MKNKTLKQFIKLLARWNLKDYLIFFLLIPSIILIIYKLPPSIKQSYFALNTRNPTIPTMFLSNYTELFLQLLEGNLIIYLLTIFFIFLTETDKKLFYTTAIAIFLIIPFFSSAITIYLYPNKISTGFSAIVSAFMGYLIYSYARLIFSYARLIFSNFSKKFSNSISLLVAILIFAIIVVFSLRIIIPSKIYFDGGQIDVYSHYFSWWFGLLFPATIQFICLLKANFMKQSSSA